MPRPGKLNRGLSQCDRACGYGNSGSVSQYGRRVGGGGDLTTGEHFLESEKWELKQFCDRKKITALTLMLLTL